MPVVRKLNFAFAKRMGKSKFPLRSDSRTNYQPAVLEFLRQELKQPIPEPKTKLILSTDATLPEEISENEDFYEGTRKRISVNAYERDSRARHACLKYHGFRCMVCAQDMSEIYGDAAVGVIHVHHIKPLSEVKSGYKVNPKADLIPVCPNCHAVIHCRKSSYTIEEVKSFLAKARQNK